MPIGNTIKNYKDFCNCDYDTVEFFVGRKEELGTGDTSIDSAFRENKIAIISGVTGEGKTALASEFLRRKSEQNKNIRICRIDFGETEEVSFERFTRNFINKYSIRNGVRTTSFTADDKREIIDYICRNANYLFIDGANSELAPNRFFEFINNLYSNFLGNDKNKIKVIVTTRQKKGRLLSFKDNYKIKIFNLDWLHDQGCELAFDVFKHYYKKELGGDYFLIFKNCIYYKFGANIRILKIVANLLSNTIINWSAGEEECDKCLYDLRNAIVEELEKNIFWLRNEGEYSLSNIWGINNKKILIALLLLLPYNYEEVALSDIEYAVGATSEELSEFVKKVDPFIEVSDKVTMHSAIAKMLELAISNDQDRYPLTQDIWFDLSISILKLNDRLHCNFDYSLILLDIAKKTSWAQQEEITIDKPIIGFMMFEVFHNLKKVTMTNNVREIGKRAFYGCESLKNIIIPYSVRKIGAYAFARSALTQIEIPASVTWIEYNSFSDCKSLEKVRFMPQTKFEWIKSTFRDCPKLKEIHIPASVKKIGRCSFMGCENLEKVTFEQNSQLEIIEEGAFNCLPQLKEIRIPASVKEIGRLAFYQCGRLRKIIIDSQSNLKIIGELAFSRIYRTLENELWSEFVVEIPDTVKEIGRCAFDGWIMKIRNS